MKIYRNLSEIKRKDKLGRRLSLTGLGILFLGMLASFVPTWYPPDQPAPAGAIARFLFLYWPMISFAALPLGFLSASIGSYFINRFARRRWPGSKFVDRPDQVLERSLKGLDDKHSYFVHSLPTSYVLTGSFGLIQFAVRSDRGRVTVNGDRWREPFSLGRLFTLFAREGVGNPQAELADQERRLRQWLQKVSVNGAASGKENGKVEEIPIGNATVFLNDSVQLDINNPSIAVLRGDQVKDYVRKRSKEVKVPAELLRTLNQTLEQNAAYQAEETE
jgi:hypothetical protein